MGYTPPWLNVVKGIGKYTIYPPGVSTDDLTILPNPVDTLSTITLLGNGSIVLNPISTGYVIFKGSSVEYLYVGYTTPDIQLAGQVADKNIFINPSGTGLLKFGTYTAGAATDSTGYITILDAAGNTRKLMVQA